jgi:hypothetical protein
VGGESVNVCRDEVEVQECQAFDAKTGNSDELHVACNRNSSDFSASHHSSALVFIRLPERSVRIVVGQLFRSFRDSEILLTSKMSYDPREHFQRIQRNLQSRGGANFGGGAGGPAGRGIAGLVLLAGVVAVGSNALFNGTDITHLKLEGTG